MLSVRRSLDSGARLESRGWLGKNFRRLGLFLALANVARKVCYGFKVQDIIVNADRKPLFQLKCKLGHPDGIDADDRQTIAGAWISSNGFTKIIDNFLFDDIHCLRIPFTTKLHRATNCGDRCRPAKMLELIGSIPKAPLFDQSR